MSDELSDENLREAARNRGLKLVKSKRRKAGAGDYGRFGLSNAGGEKLFGFGDDGLIASAGDIAVYLRKGEQSTWAESARITPAKTKPVATPDNFPQEGSAPSQSKATSKDRARSNPVAGAKPKEDRGAEPSDEADHRGRKARPAKEPERIEQPKPELDIRAAREGDAEAVAALAARLGGSVDQEAAARLIANSRRVKEDVFVADRGGIIGFLAWQTLRTLQRGAIGRITALVVEEGSRRSGVGCALLDAATRAMLDGGCTGVEAISDIDVRNAHGFFRSAEFEQTSYRFLRIIQRPASDRR